jgi:lambda repressor-like predicted transcriptional regulator
MITMHHEDIKAAIRKKGSSQAAIARELDVSPMGVNHVVQGGTSKRIARHISLVTGIPVASLWPGKYPELEFEQKASRLFKGIKAMPTSKTRGRA